MTRTTLSQLTQKAKTDSDRLRQVRPKYVSLDGPLHDAWRRDFPQNMPQFVVEQVRDGPAGELVQKVETGFAEQVNHAVDQQGKLNFLNAGHYTNEPFSPSIIRVVTDYPTNYATFTNTRREARRQDDAVIDFVRSLSLQLQTSEMTGGRPTDLMFFIDGPTTGRAVYESTFDNDTNYWREDGESDMYWLRPGIESDEPEPMLDAIVQMQDSSNIVGIPAGSVPILGALHSALNISDVSAQKPNLYLVRTPQISRSDSADGITKKKAVYDIQATKYILEQVARIESMNADVGSDAKVLAFHLSDGLGTACLEKYIAVAKQEKRDVLSLYIPRK